MCLIPFLHIQWLPKQFVVVKIYFTQLCQHTISINVLVSQSTFYPILSPMTGVMGWFISPLQPSVSHCLVDFEQPFSKQSSEAPPPACLFRILFGLPCFRGSLTVYCSASRRSWSSSFLPSLLARHLFLLFEHIRKVPVFFLFISFTSQIAPTIVTSVNHEITFNPRHQITLFLLLTASLPPFVSTLSPNNRTSQLVHLIT